MAGFRGTCAIELGHAMTIEDLCWSMVAVGLTVRLLSFIMFKI
jgi:hypothetical protein